MVAIPETLVGRAKSGTATVTLWSEANKTLCRKTARDRAHRRCRDADLSGEILAARRRRQRLAWHDRDDDAVGAATERVAKLPLSALYSQGDDPSLYIVDDKGDVTLKPVTVKSYESDSVVISGGVDDGAKVVALGVQKLDPAQKVRVVSSLSF